MRTRKLRPRKRCPSRTIIVVLNSSSPIGSYHWRFGPHTVNRWPAGDYYDDNQYMEPAYYEYEGYLGSSFVEYLEHDPDMLVDVGL